LRRGRPLPVSTRGTPTIPLDELRAILAGHFDVNCDREEWRDIGMALQHATRGLRRWKASSSIAVTPLQTPASRGSLGGIGKRALRSSRVRRRRRAGAVPSTAVQNSPRRSGPATTPWLWHGTRVHRAGPHRRAKRIIRYC
jgi:hypothetical protein